MSIEISVLSDVQLSSVQEWQHAIDAEDFALRLPTDARVDKCGGTLSVYLRSKLTNVQYRIEDSVQLMRIHRELHFDHEWKYRVSFPWIGDLDELDAAWVMAATYASATGGVVFDPQQGKVLKSQEAIRAVREMERARPAVEAAQQRIRQQLSTRS